MFNDPGFMMYVLEQEGELDTRQGKLNRAAKMLRNSIDKHRPEVQQAVFGQCGLTNMTLDELAYVRREAGM